MFNLTKIFKFSFIFIFCIGCKTSYKLDALNEKQCSNYRYGIIELKRTLSGDEKKELENKGLFIQDFLFENVYQGVWYKKWDKLNLISTPIKKLKVYTLQDKLSEGIKLSDIKSDNRNCILLIQSFAPLDEADLKVYGKLLNQNSSYYRLETQYKFLEEIASHSCIKHISIMKPIQDIPELKD
ncbi:MAG: hypothetical protein ABIO44_07830 [Saprospiraceae bacterium]